MAGERLRIDRVVADAIASDDAQLPALGGELRVGDARAADHQRLVVRESRWRKAPLMRRDDIPGEPCIREQRQRPGAEHGLALRIEQVGAEADSWGRRVHLFWPRWNAPCHASE